MMNNIANDYGIRSRRVMVEWICDAVEAIVLVQNGIIYDIILVNNEDEDSLEQKTKGWLIEDLGDLVVMPGIIDTNVCLHSNFTKIWDDTKTATTLAVRGGITTIIETPLMSHDYNTLESYLSVLETKKSYLQKHSKVDFGLLGVLEPKFSKDYQKILDCGVLGFKMYMIQCIQNSIEHFNYKAAREFLAEIDDDILLIIHPEVADDKEIFASSPLRMQAPQKRIDLEVDIRDSSMFGAANKGKAYQTKYSSFLDNDSDDNEETAAKLPAIRRVNKKMSVGLDSPTKLRKDIRRSSEKNMIEHLAKVELLTYNDKQAEEVYSSDEELKLTKGKVTKRKNYSGCEPADRNENRKVSQQSCVFRYNHRSSQQPIRCRHEKRLSPQKY